MEFVNENKWVIRKGYGGCNLHVYCFDDVKMVIKQNSSVWCGSVGRGVTLQLCKAERERGALETFPFFLLAGWGSGGGKIR